MRRKHKKKIRTATVVLVCVGTFLLLFVLACLWLFHETGNEPSTLITSVFAICGTECGVLGWIRTTKSKHEVNNDEYSM